jgi:cyclic beta-1,2-glucan synthetase
MYRVALEGILGFLLQGTNLKINPCIPRAWPGFTMTFRYRTATYEIAVENPNGVSRGVALTELDGQVLPGETTGLAPLTDDGQTHRLRVVLG